MGPSGTRSPSASTRRAASSSWAGRMNALKNEIDKLRAKIDENAYRSAKTEAASFSARRRTEVASLNRFLAQLVLAASWIYQTILRPVGRVAAVPLYHLFRWYRLLW